MSKDSNVTDPSIPRKASLTLLQLTGLAYVYSCGGAYGIEGAVSSAGAFATIVALFGAGLLWALPQAAICAELSTAFPRAGSSIYWVQSGLGMRWGTVNAACTILGQVFDLALYPGLITSYASSLIPALASPGPAYAVQAILVLSVGIANVLGVEILAVAAQLSTVITVLPFFLLPMAAAGTGQTFNWSETGPQNTPALGGGWALFASTMLWTFQGWSNIGSLASEVKDPRVSYPVAVFICVAAAILSYAYPILFGVALQPDLTQWAAEGYWTVLCNNVAHWLGLWVLLGACLANLSSGLSATALYSRTIQAVALEGNAPSLLGRTDLTRFGTPVPAIALLTVTTLALMSMSFENIVVADTLFNIIGIVLVTSAFLRLRYTHQDMSRPYKVPGGLRVAWALTVLTLCLAVGAAVVVSLGAWQQVVGVACTACAVYAADACREWRRGSSGGEGEELELHSKAEEGEQPLLHPESEGVS